MLKFRKILKSDNETITKIIRTNLEKLKLNIPGTAYFDKELDCLNDYYDKEPSKRCYIVALNENDAVIGGVGIAEFDGIDDCAEMQKLYLDDSAKGKGYSKILVNEIEKIAKDMGYKNLYLETHSNLKVAMSLYEKLGFREIEKPATVKHSTMDHFYLKGISKN